MAADFELLKDINASPQTAGSDPRNIVEVGSLIFFTATTETDGTELWKSDGTNAGTVRVKDILAGSGSSSPWNLTNVNGTLYFSANDGVAGYELWKSDGTDAGTVRVKDILAGSVGSSPWNLTNVNGTLYFSAYDDEGRELWKSDGTEPGTVRVKDISVGRYWYSYWYGYWYSYSYPYSSNPSNLTNVNGTLYFSATDNVSGFELWKSDGTEAGTVRVKDISVGSGGSSPRSLTNVNGMLYFSAYDDVAGYELWKSDGTEAGTVRVKDIFAGSGAGSPSNLTNVNGTLYFSAMDNVSGYELWKSDGTEAGTALVADFTADSTDSNPMPVIELGGRLVVVATTEDYGRELFVASLNSTPIADAGGPYIGSEGALIAFDARLSHDAEDGLNALLFEWDFDFDGVNFDVDVTGAQPSIAFTDDFDARSIAVRVTDSDGLGNIATTSLSVSNVAPKAKMTGSTVIFGETATASFSEALDPSQADTAAGFRYAYALDFDDLLNISYASSSTSSNTWSIPQLNSGSYTVYARIIDKDDSYTDYSTQIIVGKATPVLNVRGKSITYDGSAHGATGSAVGVDGQLLAGLNLGGTFTNVPGGIANWTFTDTTGNYLDASGSVAIDIAKAAAVLNVRGKSITYDGSAHGATGSALGVGGQPLAGLNLGGTFNNVPGGIANWTFTDTTGNYLNASGSVAINIGKADAIVNVVGYTGVYDAQSHGASGTVIGVAGDLLAAGSTLNLGASFTNAPGGTAAWTFDGGINYKDQSGTVLIEVNKAIATVTVTGYSGTYDALAHGATGTVVGVPGDINAAGTTLDLGASFINAPGGIANWSFNGGINYLDRNGSVVIGIDRRAIAVAADNKSKVYGSADPTLTYSITSGSLAGTDKFFGSLERDAGENAGSYIIRKGTLGIGSDESIAAASAASSLYSSKTSNVIRDGLTNYTISYQAGSLTVSRKAITYTIQNVTKPYLEELDLSPITFQTGVNGENLTLKLESAGNLPKAAVGDYPLTGTVDDGIDPNAGIVDNYDVTVVEGILTATYERARLLVLGADTNSSVESWVKVIDLKPGVVPTTFRAYEPGFRGGVRVVLADLNGDGIDEIITAPGRGRAPEIRVFSLNGEPLTKYFTMAYDPKMNQGVQIAVGDVDGDGRQDLVTVPSRGKAEVRIFSNTGGTDPIADQPRNFQAFPASFIGGAVLAIHDVGMSEGGVFKPITDGKSEILVGSGAGMRATVRTFEVTKQSIKQIRETTHFDKSHRGGIASLSVGLVNDSDKIADLIVSAGNAGRSLIEIRDGANNKLLASFSAYKGVDGQSPVRVAARDTNKDGIIDAIWTAQGTAGKSRQLRMFKLDGAQIDAVLEQNIDFRGEYFIA